MEGSNTRFNLFVLSRLTMQLRFYRLLMLLIYVFDGNAFLHYGFKKLTLSMSTISLKNSKQKETPDIRGYAQLKLVTFNILAPCYNKIQSADSNVKNEINGTAIFEASFRDVYYKRNLAIIDKLKNSKADIICLQEFWFGDDGIRNLYINSLKLEGYVCSEVRRTSRWRSRDDGLATFVKDDRIVVQDVQNIYFHDCGDRVAQLLLLALKPSAVTYTVGFDAIADIPHQQFLCVNTHLLFPHNEYSTKVRLREVTKLLGFVEAYRQKQLCTQELCRRGDIKLPVMLAGDFNGSPRGKVYKFLQSQNYKSVLDHSQQGESDKEYESSELRPRPPPSSALWISHKNHLDRLVMFDHIFFSNPSEQGGKFLPEIPDWTNLGEKMVNCSFVSINF